MTEIACKVDVHVTVGGLRGSGLGVTGGVGGELIGFRVEAVKSLQQPSVGAVARSGHLPRTVKGMKSGIACGP